MKTDWDVCLQSSECAGAPPRQRRVGGRKQYLGALVIILLALNARGNLLRFTSVVENNSFHLYLAPRLALSLLAGMWDATAASNAFCPKRQKMPDTI